MYSKNGVIHIPEETKNRVKKFHRRRLLNSLHEVISAKKFRYMDLAFSRWRDFMFSLDVKDANEYFTSGTWRQFIKGKDVADPSSPNPSWLEQRKLYATHLDPSARAWTESRKGVFHSNLTRSMVRLQEVFAEEDHGQEVTEEQARVAIEVLKDFSSVSSLPPSLQILLRKVHHVLDRSAFRQTSTTIHGYNSVPYFSWVRGVKEDLKDSQRKSKDAVSAVNATMERNMQMQNEIDALRRKLVTLDASHDRLSRSLPDQEEEISVLQVSRDSIMETQEKMLHNIARKQEHIKEMSLNVHITKQKIQDLRNDILAVEGEVNGHVAMEKEGLVSRTELDSVIQKIRESEKTLENLVKADARQLDDNLKIRRQLKFREAKQRDMASRHTAAIMDLDKVVRTSSPRPDWDEHLDQLHRVYGQRLEGDVLEPPSQAQAAQGEPSTAERVEGLWRLLEPMRSSDEVRRLHDLNLAVTQKEAELRMTNVALRSAADRTHMRGAQGLTDTADLLRRLNPAPINGNTLSLGVGAGAIVTMIQDSGLDLTERGGEDGGGVVDNTAATTPMASSGSKRGGFHRQTLSSSLKVLPPVPHVALSSIRSPVSAAANAASSPPSTTSAAASAGPASAPPVPASSVSEQDASNRLSDGTSDVGSDTATGPGAGTGTGTGIGTEAETGSRTGTATATGSGAETVNGTTVETGTGSGTGTGTGTGAEIETGSETGSGAKAETGTKAGTGTEAGAGAGTGTETDETQKETETGTGAGVTPPGGEVVESGVSDSGLTALGEKSPQLQQQQPTRLVFQGLGYGQGVPPYLQVVGPVEMFPVSLVELKTFIATIWEARTEQVSEHIDISFMLNARRRKDWDAYRAQRQTMPIFFYEELKNRHTLQAEIVKWGYNLVYAMTNNLDDIFVETFFLILTEQVPEEVHYDQVEMVRTLRQFMQRTSSTGGMVVARSDLFNALPFFFPEKSGEALMELKDTLVAQQPAKVTDLQRLFLPDPKSREPSQFEVVLRRQYLEETKEILAKLSESLRVCAATGTRVAVARIPGVLESVSPRVQHEVMIEHVARGLACSADDVLALWLSGGASSCTKFVNMNEFMSRLRTSGLLSLMVHYDPAASHSSVKDDVMLRRKRTLATISRVKTKVRVLMYLGAFRSPAARMRRARQRRREKIIEERKNQRGGGGGGVGRRRWGGRRHHRSSSNSRECALDQGLGGSKRNDPGLGGHQQ